MVPTKQLWVLSTYIKTYITVFRKFFFCWGGGVDRIVEVFRISSMTGNYWEKRRERLGKTSNM